MTDKKPTVIEYLDYFAHYYQRAILSFFLSFVCIFVGVRLIVFHPVGTFRGFVASFLLVTGIQIALWALGIRTELFGTSPDPIAADELDYDVIIEKLRFSRIIEENQREISELKSKVALNATTRPRS